jgi:predicted nucleotidyltransferase
LHALFLVSEMEWLFVADQVLIYTKQPPRRCGMADATAHLLVLANTGNSGQEVIGNVSASRIERLMQERRVERLAVASRRAFAALARLEQGGLSAWIVGSLARGTFAIHSDVDFLVDCGPETEDVAFRLIEKEMRDFPFHFFPGSDLDESKKAIMMKEAIGASSIRAHAHQAD